MAKVSRGAILTEFVFASFALRARAATADRFTLRAARFAHAKPLAPDETYRDVFRAPVIFGADFDEIELDAAPLDMVRDCLISLLEQGLVRPCPKSSAAP